MTLLAFEFPDIFIANIVKNDSLATISSKIIVSGLLFFEYLIVFIVLYEIWCFHRAILHSDESNVTRKENLLSTCILVLVAFLPSTSSIACKAIIQRADLVYSSGTSSLDISHHIHYFSLHYTPLLLIFFALLLAARASSSFKMSARLKGLSKHLLSRIFFLIFIALSSFSVSFMDPSLELLLTIPLIPFLVYIGIFFFNDWFLEGLLGKFYD